MDPEKGVLRADSHGDIALRIGATGAQGSEKCLTLDIARPGEGENLPMFAWIHGGGFMTGNASDSLHGSERLTRDGVVYVSIQYRLNMFGFFNLRTYPGCEDFETNRGLSDIAAATRETSLSATRARARRSSR